jgi:hypothetical protein
MKNLIFLYIAVLVFALSCSKDDDIRSSGTDVIDNKTYSGVTYYYYGFSFSQAKKVTTLEDPWPDIVLFVNIDNPEARLTFQTNNFRPSFFLVGEYPDQASATSAFNNLKTVENYQWVEMADPVTENQVWVYRSKNETYTKIRVVKTVNEMRDGVQFGECTFQWVHQPDGSSTFP